jgi:Glycosyl transferases group 1/Glycosyltransferase Family 4
VQSKRGEVAVRGGGPGETAHCGHRGRTPALPLLSRCCDGARNTVGVDSWIADTAPIVSLVTLGIAREGDGSSRYRSLLLSGFRDLGVVCTEIGNESVHGTLQQRLRLGMWSLTGRPRVTPGNATPRPELAHVLESVSVPSTSAQIPLVVTVHDLCAVLRPELVSSRIAVLKRLSWRRRNAWNAVIVPSQATRDDVVESGVDPERVHVIRHPVSAAFRTEAEMPPSDQGMPEGGFLLAVSPPTRKKGGDVLLRALRRDSVGGGRLIWVTRDSVGLLESADARQLVAKGSLEVLSDISDEGLALLYRRANALVVPSRWEGFSFPIAEAMSAGTGVIATDIPAHREHQQSSGLLHLVPLEDDKELAEALACALEHPLRGDAVEGRTELAFAQAHVDVYRTVTRER